MQLIVIGMHRSGTSVLARLMNLMGIYFGPEGIGTAANQENPKGFWERRDVRALNDHVLHGLGCDWNRISRFDLSKIPAPLLAEFEKRASQIVLSMDAHRPWFIKEPRLCLLLPLWLRVLEAPVCVRILRHPVEVASSLRTRNRIPMRVGLALWEYYNRHAISGIGGLPKIGVLHRELMKQPLEATLKLFQQLQAHGVRRLTLPSDTEVRAFVNESLYREREGCAELEEFADARQVRLFSRWSTHETSHEDKRHAFSQVEMKVLVSYEASLEQPRRSDEAPKYPTETELHEMAMTGDSQLERYSGKPAQEPVQKDRNHGCIEGELRQQRKHLEAESARRTSAEAKVAEGLEREAALREIIVRLETMLKGANEAMLSYQQENHRLSALLDAKTREFERTLQRLYAYKTIAADLRLDMANARLRAAARQTSDIMQRLRMEAESRALRAEMAELRERVEKARFSGQLVKFQTDQISTIDAELARLRSSISWRITAPLRKLYARFRNASAESAISSNSIVALLRQSKWFDADWYVAQYPDSRDSGVTPEIHFLACSALEARNPSPGFDSAYYLQSNPDVRASNQNPLVHYILYGEQEGRSPAPGRTAADSITSTTTKDLRSA